MNDFPKNDYILFKSDKAVYINDTGNTASNIVVNMQFPKTPMNWQPEQSRLNFDFYAYRAGAALPDYRYIDKDVNSLFSNIRVYIGNKRVVNSENVAHYLHMKTDITSNPADLYGKDISLLGGSPDITDTLPIIEYELPDPYAPGTYESTISNYNFINNAKNNNVFFGLNVASAIVSRRVSMTLHNILGSGLQGNKNIATHLLGGAVRLELDCNNARDIAFADDNANRITQYRIGNLTYKASVIYLTTQMVRELYPENIMTFTARNFYNETIYIPAGTSDIVADIKTFQFKYARAIYFFFTNPASKLSYTKMYLSQRIRANCHSYYLTKNNVPYPNKPITGVGEQYEELLKCSKTKSTLLTIETFNFNANSELTATDDLITADDIDYNNIKRFVGAINLEKFGNGTTNLTTSDDLKLHIELRTQSFNAFPITTSVHQTAEELDLMVFVEFDEHYRFQNGDFFVDK